MKIRNKQNMQSIGYHSQFEQSPPFTLAVTANETMRTLGI